MIKSKYMIQDTPGLLKFFAAKSPLYLFFIELPLWAILLFNLYKSGVTLIFFAIYFCVGILYWTLIEYLIHRFIYHTHYKSNLLRYFIGSFHAYHHENMADRRVLNAGFLMVYALLPIIISPLFLITSNLNIVMITGLGLMSAHFFYECVHFAIHYKMHTSGYFSYIQKYHFHHHDKAPTKNFGNTSHIWDVLFKTYDSSYKNYSMSPKTMESLIVSTHTQRST